MPFLRLRRVTPAALPNHTRKTCDSIVAFVLTLLSSAACLHAASVHAADPDGDGLDSTLERKLLLTYPFGDQQVISTTATGAKIAAIADIDGDGKQDVIAAAYGSSTIAWYKGTGGANPTFGSPQVISSTATNVVALAVTDLNADGHPDIVAGYGSTGSYKVAWLRNGGTGAPGTWTSTIVSTAVNVVTSVAVADINADGKLDILSTSGLDYKVAYYPGSGGTSPTFGTQTLIASGSGVVNLPYSAVATDIDGDGDQDVFSVSFTDNKLAWYRNKFKDHPAGTFDAQAVISTSAQGPVHLAVADVNGDGFKDILVASSVSDTITWYRNLNTSTPSFGAAQEITNLAAEASAVAAADFDGDGDMDVVSSSDLDDTIAWYANPGGASPVTWTRHVITTNAVGASYVAVGDLNGDGAPDIVSTSSNDNKVAWYRNPATDPNIADTDGDGLSDGAEVNTYHTNPTRTDTDGDGLADGLEVNTLMTDPTLTDSDSDGLSDYYEVNLDGNPNNYTPGTDSDPNDPDTDNDGLFDGAEIIAGTGLFDNDSDNDGLLDGFEVSYGFNPLVGGEQGQDPDGDGLTNLQEQTHSTNPLLADTDGDGLDDAAEITAGTNPNDNDSDNDGLLDGFEVTYGFNPLAGGEQSLDSDSDGLTNLQEQTAGSNPHSTDSDGDGLADGLEVNTLGTNPAKTDTDNDGASDYAEVNRDGNPNNYTAGTDTNPKKADTDGDGLYDGFEITYGYNPLNGALNEQNLDSDSDGLINLLEQAAHTNPHVVDTDGDTISDAAELARVRTRPYEARNIISTSADSAMSVIAVDLDGDGDKDVISTSNFDDKVAWYENRLNEPTQDFGPERIISNTLNGASALDVGDLDGDGDIDIVAASPLDATVVWYRNRLNEASKDFQLMTPITTTASSVETVMIAKLNSDTTPDVVITYGSTITWFSNSGTGAFTAKPAITTLATDALAIADLDGDGNRDVVSTTSDSAYLSNYVVWFKNNGGTSPTFSTAKLVGQEDQSTVWPMDADFVATADINKDGKMDIVEASRGEDTIAWYQNSGGSNPTFGLQKDIAYIAAGMSALRVVDIDDDNDPDILTSRSTVDTVAWFENRVPASNGFGAEQVITNLADGVKSAFAADLDGDGAPDVLSASSLDDTIAWYRNPATNPALADSDGDGLADNVEINTYGTNPVNKDTDGDGLYDGFEVSYGFNPLLGGEQNLDPDNDGLTNLQEQAAGTNPLVANSGMAGDLAPRGAPDGVLNAADIVVMVRIVDGQLTATSTELAAGDLNSNGVIDSGDLTLLIRAVQGLITLP